MQDVTRRSFIKLVTRTLATLPHLAIGFLVAPRHAQADDVLTGNDVPRERHALTRHHRRRGPWKVGFMVIEIIMGQTDESGLIFYPPVTSATVTVTSRYESRARTRTSSKTTTSMAASPQSTTAIAPSRRRSWSSRAEVASRYRHTPQTPSAYPIPTARPSTSGTPSTARASS